MQVLCGFMQFQADASCSVVPDGVANAVTCGVLASWSLLMMDLWKQLAHLADFLAEVMVNLADIM